MGYRPKRTSMMWRRQYIQPKICLKAKKLEKCIWNPIKIMTQENRKSDHMTGKLILLISGLERWLKILFMIKWSKLWHHKPVLISSRRLPSSRPILMITSTKRIINWGNLLIWGRSRCLLIMSMEWGFRAMNGMLGSAWRVKGLSMMSGRMKI